jgi:hypothetical protein
VLSSRRWLLLLTFVTLIVLGTALLLPGSALEWFYNDRHAPGRLLILLESTAFPFSRWFHVVVFAWLVLCLRWLYPRLRGWQVAGVLLAGAVLGELVQIPVPGRQASLPDIGDDLLGVAIGLALWGAGRAWRALRPN